MTTYTVNNDDLFFGISPWEIVEDRPDITLSWGRVEGRIISRHVRTGETTQTGRVVDPWGNYLFPVGGFVASTTDAEIIAWAEAGIAEMPEEE